MWYFITKIYLKLCLVYGLQKGLESDRIYIYYILKGWN